MSPIAGIITDSDVELVPQIASMLDVMQPGTSAVWSVIDRRPAESSQITGGREVLAQLSVPTGAKSLEPPFFEFPHGRGVMYEGELYNPGEVSAGLHTRHVLSGNNSELIARLLKERSGTLTTKLKSIAGMLDGSYVLVADDKGEIAIIRDSLGTKPVYLAHDDGLLAFASNKKALWQIGMGSVKALRAGTMAIANGSWIAIDGISPTTREEPQIRGLFEATECYQQALVSSIEKRLVDVNEVGVLLSGGVDSCLLAKLLSKLAADKGVDVTAYTAGVRGSEDTDNAQSFAREIGLECRVKELDSCDIEAYIPKVIEAVEERDLVQVEAGIGIYAAMEMAGEDGIRVVFSGQGPDELWGGYEWYPKVLEKEGYAGLCQRMTDDLSRADIETLDRENKIAMDQGMETRFPYLAPEVVNVALNVIPELKVDSPSSLGKLVHRVLAHKLGLGEDYAYRPKSAVQHGTGVHEILKQVAEKNGFDSELVIRLGYSSDEITCEKLGSSSRYGYEYADENLWQVPEPVQLFLDITAFERDLLNETERARIEQFVDRLKP